MSHPHVIVMPSKRKRKAPAGTLTSDMEAVVMSVHRFVLDLKNYCHLSESYQLMKKFELSNVGPKVATICNLSECSVYKILRKNGMTGTGRTKGNPEAEVQLKSKSNAKKKRVDKMHVTSVPDLPEDKKPKLENLNEATEDGEGGWCDAEKLKDISGPLAIKFSGHNNYIKSVGDGSLRLGDPNRPNFPPTPQETFTALRVNSNKFALKSANEKYLGIDSTGTVIERAESVGLTELWEPILRDGKLGLLGSNWCFMSVDQVDHTIVARLMTLGVTDSIQLRCKMESS